MGAAAYIQLTWEPFYMPEYNVLETRMNAGIILFIICGMLFHLDAFSSGISRKVFAVVTFAILIGVLVVILLAIYNELHSILKRRSRVHGDAQHVRTSTFSESLISSSRIRPLLLLPIFPKSSA